MAGTGRLGRTYHLGLEEKFRSYYQELQKLSRVRIPRSYGLSSSLKFHVVGFSDVSTRAYGAVVYLRVTGDTEIKPTNILVCSKSKVAPVKHMTVPRLELLGAVLLARLVRRICKTLQFPLQEVAAFSDSTIVLAWLKGPSSRFQIFIKNRVDFVQANLPAHQWRFVPTKENPADLLTRGVPVRSLIGNPLWINGPEWLKWPELDHRDYPAPLEIPELRNIKVCSAIQKEEVITEDLLPQWSDFNKLIRVVSRLLQFRYCIFKNQEARALDVRALNAIYKVSQLTFFRKEIIQLNSNQLKSSKGQLKALNPFLDAQGVLRVGRLSNSLLAYDTKHPVILHRRSVLANLLVRHIHEGYYHSTISFTINFLQSKYWIHGGASKLIKKIVHKCV